MFQYVLFFIICPHLKHNLWRKNWPCCFPFSYAFSASSHKHEFGTCLHLFHSAQEWGNGQGVSLSGTLFSCMWNKRVPQTSCDMHFAFAITGILAVVANPQLALFTEPSQCHIKGSIWSSLHNFFSHREATSQMLILHWISCHMLLSWCKQPCHLGRERTSFACLLHTLPAHYYLPS